MLALSSTPPFLHPCPPLPHTETLVLHFLGHKMTRPHTALQDSRYTADLLSPIMRHLAGQELSALYKVEQQVVPARINTLKLVAEPKISGAAASSDEE